MAELRLRGRRIVTPSGTVSGEVVIRDGRIAALHALSEAFPAATGTVIDAGERWIVPGLIDTHVHGGAGAQCNTADPDEIGTVARFHAAHGTTALLATLVPAPIGELEAALDAIDRASDPTRRSGGASVLGAHLEGPFLSPRRPGALDAAAFARPAATTVTRLRAAGPVAMMTIAPELAGALEVIEALADDGVVASLGHTDAGYERARAAVGAGARSATHLFNAMRAYHHRDPGVVVAVLEDERVSCELICDGIHVDPAALRLAHRAGRVRLVSDAIAAAGMTGGAYPLGHASVTMTGGRATVSRGDGRLAGSTLTMDAAVAGAVRWLGLEVGDAVALASMEPARLLGIDDRKGSISPGKDADLTVLDDELRACATLVAGSWVHGPPAPA